MTYQPVKFSYKQYIQLRKLIRKEFGNISIPRGIYIISYIYNKHTNPRIRRFYRKKYYTSFRKKKLRFRRNRWK